MVDLSLLQHSSLEKKSVQEDISQQLFDQIAGFVEKEDLETAAEMIHPVLSEGNLDIRLIVYYLYAHFLEEGVKSFSATLPLLSSLLEDHWKSLKPTNRKARQVENSLGWFFSHLLDKLKYSEKLAKEGREYPLWQKSVALSDKEFKQVLQSTQHFHQFFYEKWGESPTKERVTHLVKKIEDFHPMISPVEEEKSVLLEEEVPEEVIEEKVEEPVSPPAPQTGIEISEAMRSLLFKLKTFEKLLEKEEYLKAAMVSQDITHEIEHFDPCRYFPKLFTEYLALLATHIPTLAAEWQNGESLQWKSLEKLYRNDIDRFVQWES